MIPYGAAANPNRNPVTKRRKLLLGSIPRVCSVQSKRSGADMPTASMGDRVIGSSTRRALAHAKLPTMTPEHRAHTGKTKPPQAKALSGRRLHKGAYPKC